MTGNPAAASHMDRIYRRQRHFYDLTRKYYLLGRDRLVAELQPPHNGSVLEVACGTGRNLIHVARHYPTARCFGFDISHAMLETAEKSVASAGLSNRIRLAYGDATRFDPGMMFGEPHFDRVFISYALSMIPPWREALAAAGKVLAPGGRLYIVDFGQQEKWPRLFQRALFAWLRKFDVYPRPDFEQAVREASQALGLAADFHRLHGGYAYYAVLRRP